MTRWLGRVAIAGVFLLVMGSASQAAQEQQPPETQPSPEAATASCVLLASYVSDQMPLDSNAFNALVSSDRVLGVAARCVLGDAQTTSGRDVCAALQVLNQSQRAEGRGHVFVTTAVLKLSVRLERDVPDADGKAAHLLEAVMARLERALVERGDRAVTLWRELLDGAMKDVVQAEVQLGQVQKLQQELYTAAGQTELSREAIVADLKSLEREQQEVEMKLAGLHARQNALVEQIARIGKEVGSRAQEDPVAVELQKVVALREKALERGREQQKAGLAGDQEIGDIEERLALARAELAKQRQAASQAAGGNLLADLNKEVVTLAVDIAEAEARRAALHERLELAREKRLLVLADRYEREVAPQLKAAEAALREALARRLDAEELLAGYRPVAVTVLGEADGR